VIQKYLDHTAIESSKARCSCRVTDELRDFPCGAPAHELQSGAAIDVVRHAQRRLAGLDVHLESAGSRAALPTGGHGNQALARAFHLLSQLQQDAVGGFGMQESDAPSPVPRRGVSSIS